MSDINTTKVLLIYDLNPERIRFYIVNVEDSELPILKIINGEYVNSGDIDNVVTNYILLIDEKYCKEQNEVSLPLNDFTGDVYTFGFYI